MNKKVKSLFTEIPVSRYVNVTKIQSRFSRVMITDVLPPLFMVHSAHMNSQHFTTE